MALLARVREVGGMLFLVKRAHISPPTLCFLQSQVTQLQCSDRQALQGLAAAVGERLGGLGAVAQVNP